MAERVRAGPILGSLIFLVVAPGVVAGLIPWWFAVRFGVHEPFLGFEPFRWLGWALIAFGAVLLIDCFARFALKGRGTPAPIYPTEELVVSGAYRFVRNPMYVAVVSLVLGQALVIGCLPLLWYGVGLFVVFHLFVLLYEEPTLRGTYGVRYDAYRAAVGRWVPRLTPWRG